MRTWTRVTLHEWCGLCHSEMLRGAPILRITIATMKRSLFRCVNCEGPAPSDLPPLIEPLPIPTTPLVHIRTDRDSLPLDFKSAAAGEREPGMEG